MSSTDHAATDDHSVESHDAHDAHDHHEPPPPPEPESPAWLPLLGGGLFLLGLLAFLFTRTPESDSAAPAAADQPKAAAAAPEAPLRPRAFPSNPEIRALADKMRAPGAAPAPNPAAPNPAAPNRPPTPSNPPTGH